MNRKALLWGVALAVCATMCACSNPVPIKMTIAITTAPPSSLAVDGTATIAATVMNDPSNSGVDWTCSPTPSCGTFTAAHTASGATNTYTAPAAAATVTITAASTKEPTVTITANVTIMPITISLSTPPPANMAINQSATIAATVSNDITNSGVDWTCSPTPSCGTISPAHTASGATTTYTAPAAAATVTITAASTKELTVTITANVTIMPITISLSTPPPSSMEINQSATIAATVSNDVSNSGVDWTCSPTPSCGTFTPAHTASGATTVYQAPSTAGSVTITAASTKDPTATATASVTINPIGTTSNLTGTYTFFANGWDANGNSTSVAGSIMLNGTGNVTGGEQDFFDATVPDIIPQDTITGGTITLGSDGRGTLTLAPTSAPGETFSIVLVNNKHLLITEFDGNATSAGSMDLETAPTSSPTGGNAFALFDSWDEVVFGGVIASDGTIVTDAEADADVSGNQFFDFTFNGDSINAPDPHGRGTMSLDGLAFAYYVVGPEAFRLIEIDGNGGNFFLAGSMYGQGTAAGAYSAASLKGNFVFGQAGEDLNPNGIFLYGAVGQFNADGSSVLTSGVADVNQGDGAPVFAGDMATGSAYGINPNGYGRITIPGTTTNGLANFGIYMVDPGLNVADPNSASGGGGALMSDLDINTQGIGIVVPQSTGATFAGNYAFNQDGTYQTASTSAFIDLLGQVLSDGSSNLTGAADFNDLGNTGLNPNLTVTGTFTPDPANPGRVTAQLNFSGAAQSPETLSLYQASSNLLLHLDMDSPSSFVGNTSVGVFEKQQ